MTDRDDKSRPAKAGAPEDHRLGPYAEASEEWQREWLTFPTVTIDAEGCFHYWDVPADTHIYATDWKIGESLARATVAQMQRFPAGSSVLRRILRQIDQDSLVAQGFLARIEDMLTNPPVFLETLAPGSVQAKLSGELPIPHWSAPPIVPIEGPDPNIRSEQDPSSSGRTQ